MTTASSGRHHDDDTTLELYDEAARAAAEQVIGRYSTSFGLGARLLPRAMREHIACIYAMVRVADEIVDTYQGDDAGDLLDAFEAEVSRAMAGGFSTNLIAHAFGATSRAVGIDHAMVDPFFASMRMDLDVTEHDRDSFERYVFGSAEVIGVMCLAVFINTGVGPRPLDPDLVAGARRLGAAYQKVNFLRDLGADSDRLGRSYFPGIDPATLTGDQLAEIVAECRADIEAARATLPELPRRARVAVGTTVDIYDRLLDGIEATDASALRETRVRVPDAAKAVLALRNAVAGPARRSPGEAAA